MTFGLCYRNHGVWTHKTFASIGELLSYATSVSYEAAYVGDRETGLKIAVLK